MTAPPLVESPMARFSRFLERNKGAALAAFTIIYFVGIVFHARSKMFWHDEIYTVMLSRLSVPEIWSAISAGADASPPMINLLVKGVVAFVPEGEISIRIPAMVGFWIFCLCLFRFVNRRLGVFYGFAALFLPFGTGAFYFATEARCYAPLLGFVGIALVCWQTAAEGRARSWALPLLAISLGCVIFSHYYGSFVYLPFAGAELCRGLRRRSLGLPALDWPMYIAFLAGMAPVLSYYWLASNMGSYTAHPWNAPRIQDLYLFYKIELASELVSAVVFLALMAIYFRFGRPLLDSGKSNSAVRDHAVPDYEIVAALFFAAMPALCLPVAFAVTHSFSDRYALTAIGGIVLLCVFVVSYLARGNRVTGAILLVASILPFIFALALHQGELRTPLEMEPLLREAIQDGPVAIDDGPLFLQAWYYLPPRLKSRVFYLADLQAALEVSGSDHVDKNFLVALPWMHIPAIPYQSRATPGAAIVVYHSGTIWSWLPTRLLKDGARIEVLAADRDRSILKATLPVR